MAGLTIDVAGLNAGAASRADITDLRAASREGGSGSGDQPSHAGVSRFGAAVASVRIRQSARIRYQRIAMSPAAIRYSDTDDEGAGAVARAV
jgi:hypothetical protein